MAQHKHEVLPGTLYSLTRAGQKQLLKEEDEWHRTAAIVTRFLTPAEEKQ